MAEFDIEDGVLKKCYEGPWQANVSVPDGVTAIGREAFKANYHVKHVQLPASVRVIDDLAFCGCTDLVSVTLSGDASEISIGYKAFLDCERLESVNFLPLATYIGEMAFDGCSGLKEAVLGPCLEHLGSGAFKECEYLAEVDLSECSITLIEDDTFFNCGLDSIALPASIRSLGSRAFYGCNLKEADIENVTDIGAECFAYCKELEQVNLGSAIHVIQEGAFLGCAAMTHIDLNEVQVLGDSAFYNSGLVEVSLPASLCTIGDDTFKYCEFLSSVRLNSISGIEDGMFSFCPALETIELPDSVTYIANDAFRDSGLKAVHLPASIGVGGFVKTAFYGCPLETLLPDNIDCLRLSPALLSLAALSWARNNATLDELPPDQKKQIIKIISKEFIKDHGKLFHSLTEKDDVHALTWFERENIVISKKNIDWQLEYARENGTSFDCLLYLMDWKNRHVLKRRNKNTDYFQLDDL